jgi:hypothetical protein
MNPQSAGAKSLRSLASEMERAAVVGDVADLEKLLPLAAGEFEQLKMTLKHAGWF